MPYKDIKKVRAHNGDNFIKDFNSVFDVMVSTESGHYHVLKREIWNAAKDYKINYKIRRGIFLRDRPVMVIL